VNIANWSSSVELRFLAANVSVALAKIAISRTPVASARSRPRSFGTRTGARTPSGSSSWSSNSAASASWGTHFGCTKLVVSTVVSPASTSRRMNSALTATSTTADSFCNPSRGPTS